MKKIIRLTESELSEAIERALDEKQGVPSNMYESAVQLYNDFIFKVSSIPSYSTQDEFEFELHRKYQIGDYQFNGVDLTLKIVTHHSPDHGVIFLGAGVKETSKIQNKKINISPQYGELGMYLKFAAPSNWQMGEITKHIQDNKPDYVSNFAHELKHSYDDTVKTSREIYSRTEYNTFQEVRMGKIEPINTFLHNSYFIHEIEEGVRSSEFHALLKSSNITKSQFKTFFYDTELIKKFKEIRSFKLTTLINELHQYLPFINDAIEQITQANPTVEKVSPDATDDERIKIFLNLFYQVLTSHKVRTYDNLIFSGINPLSIMFGTVEANEAQEMVDNYVKRAQKYKNYEDFFVNEEKRFNFVGEKMLRKLGKLYDMIDNDEKSSIGNWDLHHKINKTSEKTLEEIKKLAREGKLKLTTGNVFDKNKKKPT